MTKRILSESITLCCTLKETVGEEIWSQKRGQRDSSTAGGRWRRQLKADLDVEKWSVVSASLGMTRHISSAVYRDRFVSVINVNHKSRGTVKMSHKLGLIHGHFRNY